MDEGLWTFVLALGCGAFAALLGAAFGAVAGLVYWREGKASGTKLGHGVAQALERAGGRELSPGGRGALVGAVDGFVFLGVVGTVVGVLVARAGHGSGAELGPAAVAAVLLASLATGLGLLAYGLVRAGVWALAAACLGAFVGGALGRALGDWVGLLAGCVGGFLLGNVGALLVARYAPRFTAPSLDDLPRRHRVGDPTDVQGGESRDAFGPPDDGPCGEP
jgi:hypothetical protein